MGWGDCVFAVKTVVKEQTQYVGVSHQMMDICFSIMEAIFDW